MRAMLACTLTVILFPALALAEDQASIYVGHQSVMDSDVDLHGHPDFGDAGFDATWKGKSFSAPPYWGIRWTRWQGDWGWGAEFTHVKAYADDDTLARSGFSHLEMTDGANIATVNLMRRWQPMGRVTPYAGAGVGVAVPHFEAESPSDETAGYQLTGPALRWMAGASVPLNDRWSVFGEYQVTWSRHEADFDGGGTFRTDLVTHALNIGLSFGF